ISELEANDVIRMMVGRDVEQIYERPEKTISSEVVLEVRGLSRGAHIRDVSFALRKAKSSALPDSSARAGPNWPKPFSARIRRRAAKSSSMASLSSFVVHHRPYGTVLASCPKTANGKGYSCA